MPVARPRGLRGIRQMAGLVRPHRAALIGVLASLVVLSCCDLSMPFVLKFVINNVFYPGEAGVADPQSLMATL